MDSIRVVSRFDPAIDQKKSNLAEYRKTLDMGRLVFADGRKPIVFQIRDLDYDDYQECLLFNAQPSLAADRAFRFGVVGIEGCAKLCDGGAWRPSSERSKGGQSAPSLSVDDMRYLFPRIAPKHLLDIGQLIIERAEMEREGNGVGGAAV